MRFNDLHAKVIAALNQQTADEYQRLQNRLRNEPDPEVDEMAFSPVDLRILRSLRISPA